MTDAFTPLLRDICAGTCGDRGEPACWRLPELTSDCKPEDITPCDECLALAALKKRREFAVKYPRDRWRVAVQVKAAEYSGLENPTWDVWSDAHTTGLIGYVGSGEDVVELPNT